MCLVVRIPRTVHLRFIRVRLFRMRGLCSRLSLSRMRTGVAIGVSIVSVVIIVRTVGFFVAVVDTTGTGVGGVGPRVVRRGSGVVAVAVLEDLETFGQDAHVAELDLGTEGDDQVDDLGSQFFRVEMMGV